MSPRRTAPPRQLDRFYTVKQAAQWLIPADPDDPESENSQAGERWLRDGVNHKGWPHHRFGRRLMFSESDLAEIAQCHRNAPTRAGRPRRGARKQVAAPVERSTTEPARAAA